MSERRFNYAIGRYWEDDSDSVCIYARGAEIHYGTMEDAEWLLGYVRRHSDPEVRDEYKIFKLVELTDDAD